MRAICWESRASAEDQGGSAWLSRYILPGTKSSAFPSSAGPLSQVVYNELLIFQLDTLWASRYTMVMHVLDCQAAVVHWGNMR